MGLEVGLGLGLGLGLGWGWGWVRHAPVVELWRVVLSEDAEVCAVHDVDRDPAVHLVTAAVAVDLVSTLASSECVRLSS